tara:strand:+ start:24306 stop:25631 length:1326 start_codon:yes stop_codon:yes gene_type:complete
VIGELEAGVLFGAAERWGTPLFLLSLEEVERHHSLIVDAFAPTGRHPKLFFSLKTNHLPVVCSHIRNIGCGVEVVCKSELDLAHQMGFRPEQIVVNGAGKSNDYLALALEGGFYCCNVDGIEEAHRLDRLARDHSKEDVTVGLRVNLDIYPFGAEADSDWMRHHAKFGSTVSNGDARRVAAEVGACDRLRLKGLHVHLGSPIGSVGTYSKAIDRLLEFANDLSDDGHDIRILNLGGGYATRSLSRISRDRYDRLSDEGRKEALRLLVDEAEDFDFESLAGHAKRVPDDMELVLEPGRFLVADSMVYVAEVTSVRRDTGMTWVFLDGGVNHLPTMGPNELRSIRVLTQRRLNHHAVRERFALAGPVCHRGDVLAYDASLEGGAPNTGDLIMMGAVGAYSVSMANSFNGYQPPVVVVEHDGNIRSVWRRETFEDLFVARRELV